MSVDYTFLPWVRQGLVAGIATQDDLADSLPARSSVSVELTVNQHSVDMPMDIYGPGDVTALDNDQVVRREPPPGTGNAEPNYFPLIEFDRPDLPWLFTPASATDRERLRPWLVLVVVEEQPGVSINSRSGAALPVLRIEAPALPGNELPDLAQSWAWAHAQVIGAAGEPIDNALQAGSVRNVSRLLCPRRLDPEKHYHACVVPAFEPGRRAGLGTLPSSPSTVGSLEPAWRSGADSPMQIELPLYQHWSFATGRRGDFESLVRQLRGQRLPRHVGTRAMSVKDIGFGVRDLGIVRLGGVLRSANTRLGIVSDDYKQDMRRLLNLSGAQDEDPLLAPPVYGGFQSWNNTVPEKFPRWLRRVNLDPRYRVAAGLGTRVVQDLQEELMGAAWQQLAHMDKINQLRRQAQLAQEVGRSVHSRHVSRLSTDRIFQFSSSVRFRVRLAQDTLAQDLHNRGVTVAATSNAFRRVARARGPVMRRFGLMATRPGQSTQARFFLRLAIGGPRIPWVQLNGGMVTSTSLQTQIGRLNAATQGQAGNVQLRRARRLRASAQAMAHYVNQARNLVGGTAQGSGNALKRRPTEPDPNMPDTLDRNRETLLQQLDPVVTVPRRIRNRLQTKTGERVALLDATDPDSPMPAPQFDRPMYEPLANLSQDYMLPGLGSLPIDSVSLAETDPAFIEAFMIGLNHEMSRELLWRRFPTDQRATYFRMFWDTRGLLGSDNVHMPALHEWNPQSRLGETIVGNRSARLVLLIRGELLRRYPGTVITIVRPHAVPALEPADEFDPVFRGRLDPDITFVGFDLSAAEVLSDATGSYYILLEQPPADLRFGMDVATAYGDDAIPLSSWNDLSWGHMVDSAEQISTLTHVPLERLAGTTLNSHSWGHNASHMAAITVQQPVRIAIRANIMLPKAEPPLDEKLEPVRDEETQAEPDTTSTLTP